MHAQKANPKRSDIQEGKLIRIELDGKALVLTAVKDKIYAIDAICSHEGGPLEDGTIEGYSITCPWHQAIFDIRSGKVSPDTSWATDLNSYAVTVNENTGDIYIDTDPERLRSVTTIDTDFRKKGKGEGNDAAEQKKASLSTDDNENVVPSKPLKVQLKLIEKITHEGTDMMSFKFSISNDGHDAPGQNHLRYKAGQYAIVDLGTKDDPEGPLRSFTLASSPTESTSTILITTRIRDTPFKRKLASLEIGSIVKITSPLGDFVLCKEQEEHHSKPVVFLSGGIGVTPFRSMIKYATDKRLPLRIVMFDSNRNTQNILYKDEFDSWAEKNKNVKIVYTITNEEVDAGWKGERGRIDRSMLERHLKKDEINNAVYYICGPSGMLKAMQRLLEEDLQIPKDRIKLEEFTGYW